MIVFCFRIIGHLLGNQKEFGTTKMFCKSELYGFIEILTNKGLPNLESTFNHFFEIKSTILSIIL